MVRIIMAGSIKKMDLQFKMRQRKFEEIVKKKNKSYWLWKN